MQFLAFNIFHDDKHFVIHFLDSVDGGDVGMVQRRGSLRLDFESLAFLIAGGNLAG